MSDHPTSCTNIATTLQIIGDRWTGLIILNLTSGTKRFGQLQQLLTGISPRTLSQRLDTLERDGLISKQHFAEVPPRVEYTLLSKGKDLLPILQSMDAWGKKYSV